MASAVLQAKSAVTARPATAQENNFLKRRKRNSILLQMKFGRKCSLTALVRFSVAMALGAASQLSQEHGNSLARKMDSIAQHGAAAPVRPKTTRVPEVEVNSYLAFNAKEKLARGLTNPQIRMVGDGQLAGRVYMDIDDFKRGRKSRGIMDPFSYLSGQVPVTARGVLRTRDGMGQFQLDGAELHGVPLPKPLVQELVSYFSRTPERPNGFNLDEPFQLPAKIRTITINSGEAVIAQ